MHSIPKVRFENFEVEDLSYYMLDLAYMNSQEHDWLRIVHFPKHYSESTIGCDACGNDFIQSGKSSG